MKQPAPELAHLRFPPDLRLLDFEAGRRLRLRYRTARGQRAFWAAFCLLHYLIFPGALTIVLTGSHYPGVAAGAALWAWRVWLGHYVSIDFRKRRFWVVTPASFQMSRAFPEVTLETVSEGSRRHSRLRIGGQEVLSREADGPHPPADLVEFAAALLTAMGADDAAAIDEEEEVEEEEVEAEEAGVEDAR